jgi:hypothetical protein
MERDDHGWKGDVGGGGEVKNVIALFWMKMNCAGVLPITSASSDLFNRSDEISLYANHRFMALP